MPENQKAIYYLASDSLKSAKSAPFVEKLIQKDIEVSLFKGSVAFGYGRENDLSRGLLLV